MVDFINNPLKLEQDVNAFAYSSDCPAALRDKLTTIPGSQADRIQGQARVLYAHYDQLNEAGKRAMAQLFSYAENSYWTTFNEKNGSADIVEFAARDLGDQGAIQPPPPGEWPSPSVELADGNDWRGEEETES